MFTDIHTHGPMADTLDLGSRDLKTCFDTKNCDHRKFDPITLGTFLPIG
jgi:hypothetical protein